PRLTNPGDNSGESLSGELVRDVVLSHGVHPRASSPAGFLPRAQCALVLCNELCAFVQIIKVPARQLLAPSRTRPRSRLTQVCSRSGGQDVARPRHRASILVLEIANGLGRKPAV